MLFHLLTPLSEQFTPFNLFRYITFRSGGAVVTALLISFFDDYKKLTKRSSSGLSGRAKLAAEIIVATLAAILVMHLTRDPLATTLAVPFFKNLLIPFGGFFIALNVV